MANQIIIDIGAVANDGTGDPLRTAFGYVNDNFSNVWATGVANANIGFSGNKILTVNTNGNLVLAPNGTGKVVANVDIVPNMANVRNLGAINNRWSTVYSQYLNVTNDVDFTGDVTIGGNLTVEGDTIQIGNITTDTKTIQLANTANTANAATGSGVTVGANDNIATMLYNSTSNTWVMNIGLDTPNIVVNNITSDDSTFVTVQDGLNVDGEIESAGNVTAPYFFGNASQMTGITSYSNTNATSLLASFGSNTISTTGNITAGYFIGNGSQLTGLPDGTAIVNGTSQIDIPVANGNIYVGVNNVGSTEFTALGINTLDLAALGNVTADGTVQGNVVTANSAINTAGTIGATGNISGGNIISNGEIISNSRAYVQYVDIRGGNPSGTIGQLGYGGNIPFLYGTEGVNIITGAPEVGPQWQFGTDGTLTTPGNIAFTDNVVYSGGTFTSPESNGILNNFKWKFSDTVSGADTVTLQWNLLDTTFPQWYLTTNSQGNIYVFDGDAKTLGFLDNSNNSGTLTFGTAANNGAGNSNDIELTTVTGNAYVRTGSNSWLFDNNGDLRLPYGGYIGANNDFVSLYSNIQSELDGISIQGNSVTTITNQSNVSIVADEGGDPQTWTFDNTGTLTAPGAITTSSTVSGQVLISTQSAANEGGEIQLALPSSGTTLTGNIIIDSYQNSIRFFESGNSRGLYVDTPNVSVSGQYAIGYRDVPQIALSGNVTANSITAGKHFYSTTAGNLQVTIPDNANVPFALGATLTIVMNAAGNVIVAQGTGVSLYMAGSSTTGNRTVGAYGLASVMKVATDTWVISGTGVY